MDKQELLKSYKKLSITSNNCDGCYNCYNCNDCYDCYNCYNCILCKGLSDKVKGYWLLNKEVSREEWNRALATLRGKS